MHSKITAHPEAIINSICDVQGIIEAKNLRCKIMVMSSLCYASLLKEDYEKNGDNRQVKKADAMDVLKYGYIGTMWGAVIYIDQDRRAYDIEAYGGDCLELQIDHFDIWNKVQEIKGDL